MGSNIPIKTLVDGISISMQRHTDNPAVHEQNRELFDDEWYEILAESDGSNPFFPHVECWRTCVVWVKADNMLDIGCTDGSVFVQLYEGDEICHISVTEEKLTQNPTRSIYGFWKNIYFFRLHEGELRHAQLLHQFKGD